MGQSIQEWTRRILWKTALLSPLLSTLEYFVSYLSITTDINVTKDLLQVNFSLALNICSLLLFFVNPWVLKFMRKFFKIKQKMLN